MHVSEPIRGEDLGVAIHLLRVVSKSLPEREAERAAQLTRVADWLESVFITADQAKETH